MAKKVPKFQFNKSTRELAGRLMTNYLGDHLGKISMAILLMVVVALATGWQVKMLEPAINDVLRGGDRQQAVLLPILFFLHAW
ncbi:MAG: hypothetical protein CMM76_02780 [Rhodospirillaceae bacterium]|nr:hypothetical protein [Rhodospirillaceae bacterium]